MTGGQTKEQLLAKHEIVRAPVERACRDQSFEIPTGIYVAMASMFAGFVAVLGLAFRGGHMAVVMGVIFAFIAAFFAVPTIFPRIAAEETRSKALSWFEFTERGNDGIWLFERSQRNRADLAAALFDLLLWHCRRHDRGADLSSWRERRRLTLKG